MEMNEEEHKKEKADKDAVEAVFTPQAISCVQRAAPTSGVYGLLSSQSHGLAHRLATGWKRVQDGLLEGKIGEGNPWNAFSPLFSSSFFLLFSFVSRFFPLLAQNRSVLAARLGPPDLYARPWREQTVQHAACRDPEVTRGRGRAGSLARSALMPACLPALGRRVAATAAEQTEEVCARSYILAWPRVVTLGVRRARAEKAGKRNSFDPWVYGVAMAEQQRSMGSSPIGLGYGQLGRDRLARSGQAFAPAPANALSESAPANCLFACLETRRGKLIGGMREGEE